MNFGRYTVDLINFGTFRLDGGAMFGSVPKNLWSRNLPADDQNCIPLATRCLLLRDKTRTILVDVGCGDKYDQKRIDIFAIKNIPESSWGFHRDEVTDIILTHLHFDHAGGISRYTPNGKLELTFPNATIHLQAENYFNAKTPNLRERASYLPENVEILDTAKCVMVRGTVELLPEIWVHEINGHTKGQQWIEIRNDQQVIFYPTDMIPTSHHLPLPYHMGYDICAATVLEEKEKFLRRAVEEDAIVIFEHDPHLPAAKIKLNEKGHYAVKEEIHF